MRSNHNIAGMRSVLTSAVVTLLLGNAVALAAIEPLPETVADHAQSTVPTLVAGPGDTVAPASTTVPTGGASPTTTRPAAKSVATTTTTSSLPRPHSQGEYTFEVTLSPMCMRPGDQFTVTMHLRPNQAGSLIAMYSDGRFYGTRHAGYAGPDGILTYSGVAGAATGEVVLLTGSSDGEGRSGGTRIHFRVVEPAETC